MKPPRLFITDRVAPQRWRNGGGVTRELLAWPEGADWSLRISVADIETDGPFSTFPGVTRWFTVIEGAGVELDVAGAAHVLRPGDPPLNFDGAASANCRLLAGATRDLNLMLRGRTGSMSRVGHAQAWSPGLACCGLYAAVAGRCAVNDGEEPIDLPAHALLWFDKAPACIRFDAAEASSSPAGWWMSADQLENE